MVLPGNLTDQEIQLIHSLRVDEEELNASERETRQQGECNKWKEERSLRLKCQQNQENFAKTLLDPKPVSSKYLRAWKKLRTSGSNGVREIYEQQGNTC